MSTINQQNVFRDILVKIAKGKKISLGKIMKDNGYSEATARNPGDNLTSQKGFRELLATIGDSSVLARFYQILMHGSDRDSLNSGKELLKLKDRYPDKKIKMGVYETIDEVFGDTKDKESDDKEKTK